MASAAISSAEHSGSSSDTGDPFNSPLVWLCIVLLVLLTIGTAVGIGLIYYGDDVHAPGWSEHSVPPPTEP